MKKAYCKPEMEWVCLQPDVPVAAPCWSHAGKQHFYHDVPGHGYCEVYLSDDGCGKATIFSVVFPDAAHMTSQEKAEAEAWMMDHLSEKLASSGNNMASFKGNEFLPAPDPSWS